MFCGGGGEGRNNFSSSSFSELAAQTKRRMVKILGVCLLCFSLKIYGVYLGL